MDNRCPNAKIEQLEKKDVEDDWAFTRLILWLKSGRWNAWMKDKIKWREKSDITSALTSSAVNDVSRKSKQIE